MCVGGGLRRVLVLESALVGRRVRGSEGGGALCFSQGQTNASVLYDNRQPLL